MSSTESSRVGRGVLGNTLGNVLKTGNEIEKVGMPFLSSFVKKLVSGSTILFWDDIWVNGNKLKESYPRLYNLEANKNITVSDKRELRDNNWTWVWDWIREP